MSTYKEYTKKVSPCACHWHARTSNGTSAEGDFFTDESDYKVQYIWDGNDSSYARIHDYDSPKSRWGVTMFRLNTASLPSNARPYSVCVYHKIAYGMVATSDYHASAAVYSFAPLFSEAVKTKPTVTYTGNSVQSTTLNVSANWDSLRTSNNNGTTHIGFNLMANTNIDTYRRFYELYTTWTYRVYTFSVVVTAGEGGTATGGGNYEDLSSFTIKATPNPGYRFLRWSDGSTSATRTLTATQDTGYTAYFEKNQYEVHLYSEDLNKGTVSGSGTYDYGSVVTVSATANAGYRFRKWSDGSVQAVRNITVTDTVYLTAYFEVATPVFTSVEITPNPANTGQGFIIKVGVY